ncbi:hypothetical protein K470DRAFT_12130 [Piedraia hortae CBS 480.64]|uniref:Uncharacterized protein n=1 Tax=Piedraia hortae CBS 480.64 TaxID=1314780 RepID=A0A6A7BRS8_9PEZI|nr:hypothetical protein K470DRAFT_12130 [Piedraia hortae CBS 480.64]
MDNIEKLASSSNDITVSLIYDEACKLKKERVVNMAATHDLDGLHGRIKIECCKRAVELSISNTRACQEILSSLLGLSVAHELVQTMRYKTHGFTSSALLVLVEFTVDAAEGRLSRSVKEEEITLADYQSVSNEVKHNALGAFIVTKPQTQCSDIGGSTSLRERVKALYW